MLEAGDRYLVEHLGNVRDGRLNEGMSPKLSRRHFGEIKYLRTYFHHKSTGKYAYLVDRLAGCGPHARGCGT